VPEAPPSSCTTHPLGEGELYKRASLPILRNAGVRIETIYKKIINNLKKKVIKSPKNINIIKIRLKELWKDF
jgi:hypothetical protein